MGKTVIATILVTLAVAGYSNIYVRQRRTGSLSSGKLYIFAVAILLDIAGTTLLIVRTGNVQLSYYRIIAIAAVLAMILYFYFQIILSRQSENRDRKSVV